MTAEKILTEHGKAMYRLGIEYAITMIDMAEITETDLKQILKERLERLEDE